MSEFRLSPEAEAQLDDIWVHIPRESRNAVLILHIVHGSRDIVAPVNS